MSPSLLLSQLIAGAAGSTTLLALAIVVGTFILEDPTTIIVGVLAADGVISVPLALASLYAGIIIGDIVLYALGYLASTHPRLGRYVDHDYIAPFRTWIESRFILTVFTARFIPGSRLPTYTASGFFRSPLPTFIMTAVVATSVWTTILFTAAYWFGNISAAWVREARWGSAFLVIAALFLFARHTVQALRATQAADTADDTHTS